LRKPEEPTPDRHIEKLAGQRLGEYLKASVMTQLRRSR
jgi:hypothetical protein